LAFGDGDFNGAFHSSTLDLVEIEFPFTGARLGPTVFLAEKYTTWESEHAKLIAHTTLPS